MGHKANILIRDSRKIKNGANSLRNIKFYALLTALTVLIGAHLPIPAISSLMKNLTISSSGQISTTTIWAKSGYAEDIQAAVDTVATAGGGTVYIPEGTFYWNASSFTQTFWGRPTGVIIPGGVNVIGAGANKTILQVIERAPDDALMFGVDGGGKSVRISGIHFIGYVVNESENIGAIRIVDGKDFRVDHCIFKNFDNAGITTRKQSSNKIHRGVIDHNIFDNPYKETMENPRWGYGIIVSAYYGIKDIIWKPLDDYLGKYEDNVVYIEDNIFHSPP